MENSQNTEFISKNTDNPDDEISLLDLIAVLLHYKFMIIAVTGFAMFAAVVFSIISLKLPPEKSPLPNSYTPKAHMLIKEESGAGGISGSMSSLASLAGVSLGGGGSSRSALAVYLSTSNEYLDAVNKKFNLTERYKIEKAPLANTRKAMKKTLVSDFDEESSVFTIGFTDIDPVFARDVVNFAVDWMQNRFDELGLDTNRIEKKNLEANIEATYKEILKLEKEAQNLGASVNKGVSVWGAPNVSIETSRIQMELSAQQKVYEQLKTQYELLKVKMQSEQPVFQILERPEIPDLKSKPSRGKLCIIITFAAFFMSVFAAFALNAWQNIKNDPEARKKLNLKTKEEKRV
ncbi:MAG: lipopolysaccharide biosynthesis protein [Spirochaetia bacterium]|nr:lipopolysaccharide biosynthesis protein [Spirochaetia bacterium]